MGIEFSKNLLKARQNLKLSQKELAEKANVSPASLSAYEQRGKFPSLDVAARIAEALGVSLDWLVGREKEKKVDSVSGVFASFLAIARSGITYTIQGDKDGDTACFCVKEEGLAEVFNGWKDILKLYNTGTINGELYDLWLDKKLSDLEKRYDGFVDLDLPF